LERDFGIGPFKRFPWKFKDLKEQEVTNLSGITPLRLLFIKYIASRLLVNVIKDGEIAPYMLLNEISRYLKLEVIFCIGASKTVIKL
jgi:hypothetical protein